MRKVDYVKLHQGIFVPGVGNLKDTLPPDNKSFSKLEMYVEDNGALILNYEIAGKGLGSLYVGAANVAVARFAPGMPDRLKDEKDPPKATDKPVTKGK